MIRIIIKLIKCINIFLIFLLSVMYINYQCNSKSFDIYNKSYNKNIKKYYNDKIIYVPKINLYKKIEKANNNFSNMNYNIVYYNNFNVNDKIILFAHSGMGFGTYFNRIDELNKSDELFLFDKNKEYKYYVYDKYLVNENDIYLMNNEMNSNKLLLITCDKNDKSKRLIVQLYLKSVKNL